MNDEVLNGLQRDNMCFMNDIKRIRISRDYVLFCTHCTQTHALHAMYDVQTHANADMCIGTCLHACMSDAELVERDLLASQSTVS